MPKIITLPPSSSGRQGFKPSDREIKDWIDVLGKAKENDDWVVSDQDFNNRQAASRYGKLYEDAITEQTKKEVKRRSYETDAEGVFRFALKYAA